MAHRLLVLVLCGMSLMTFGCDRSGASLEQVRIGARDWDLELAISEAAIRRGLMDRATIPAGTGMIFVFSTPTVHRFWMANCLIDIDVIFLDGQGRVTTMYRMKAEPARGSAESQLGYEQRLPLYSSHVPVRFAIEFPAGSIDHLGLRVGDRVDIDVDRLKSMTR
ncbi:MAG: DUF192 domain-containing protein [Phycisphaerae bacterium]|jgi:uncharacterized protein|nr:DUF192 domain-containing protein [Phycisphaerae bacterium]MBT5383115.1 DUF192 domain-containing protein [Phycisphaerae bacterium]MBT5658144.1 DUF192 domain-containing protein [Phycisphaerae bacterium]